jgi:hypothetical protein
MFGEQGEQVVASSLGMLHHDLVGVLLGILPDDSPAIAATLT